MEKCLGEVIRKRIQNKAGINEANFNKFNLYPLK